MKEDIKIIRGKTIFCLSAPHAFEHKRPSLCSKYKQGEPWTDYIVKEICSDTKSNGVISTRTLEYDPNYHVFEKNNYKQNLRDLVNKNKLRYFFDLHGLNDKYQYDFGIYYVNRYHKSKILAYELSKALNKGGLRHCLVQILNIPETKQKTLTQYASSDLRVPSVQVEISRYIREEDNLRKEFIKNFSDLLTALS